jgi:hypothetical protein
LVSCRASLAYTLTHLRCSVGAGVLNESEADACLNVEAGLGSCQWWAVGILGVGRMLVGDSVLTCVEPWYWDLGGM